MTRLSPGYSGNFAIKVQSTPTATQAGQFGYGKLTANQLLGGIPFTARPDSLTGYFVYHIAVGDTATVLVVLKNQGTIIGSDTLLILGSNTGFYAHKTKKIKYRSSAVPDSLILLVTCTRPKLINPSSYVIVDNIGFVTSSQSVPNGGFESWFSRSYHDPIGWTTQNILGLTTGEYPVTDTTGHFGGHLAARLKNNNQGSYYQEGYMYIGKVGSKGLLPGIAVNQLDTFFTGYYKFYPSNSDTCTFSVSMFRNDTLVGSGSFHSKDTVSVWTPFVVPINYIPGFQGNPDSAAIQVAAFRLGSATSPRGNSILLVDDISFNTFSTGIMSYTTALHSVQIAPNPFREYTTVQFELPASESIAFKLFNLEGLEIKSYPPAILAGGKQSILISAEGLAPGIYFLSAGVGSSFKTQKLIVIP